MVKWGSARPLLHSPDFGDSGSSGLQGRVARYDSTLCALPSPAAAPLLSPTPLRPRPPLLVPTACSRAAWSLHWIHCWHTHPLPEAHLLPLCRLCPPFSALPALHPDLLFQTPSVLLPTSPADGFSVQEMWLGEPPSSPALLSLYLRPPCAPFQPPADGFSVQEMAVGESLSKPCTATSCPQTPLCVPFHSPEGWLSSARDGSVGESPGSPCASPLCWKLKEPCFTERA